MNNTQGYYITSNGERVIIDSQESIDLSDKNIVELILPSGIKRVYCNNNQIKELILPSGIEYISCENNNITGLILPSGVKTVYCDDAAIDDPIIYKEWDINLVIYLMK